MLRIPRPRKKIESFEVSEAALTPRQADIYRLIKKGCSVQEIAEQLGMDRGNVCREIKRMKEISERGLLSKNVIDLPLTAFHALRALASEEEISQLTQREAEVVVFYTEGNTYSEIAEQLNIDTNTVNALLYRARKKLRKETWQKVKNLNRSPCCYIGIEENSELYRTINILEDPLCRDIIRNLFEGKHLSVAERRIIAAYGMASSYSMEVSRAKGLNLLRAQGKKYYSVVTVKYWANELIKKAVKAANITQINEGRPYMPCFEDVKYKVSGLQMSIISAELAKYFETEEEYKAVYMYADGYSLEEIANRMGIKVNDAEYYIYTVERRCDKKWEAVVAQRNFSLGKLSIAN